MKQYLYLAAAIMAMASCSNNDYVGGDSAVNQDGSGAIAFGFDMQNATRAESTGATAAGKLSNQFVVYAEKNESGAASSLYVAAEAFAAEGLKGDARETAALLK